MKWTIEFDLDNSEAYSGNLESLKRHQQTDDMHVMVYDFQQDVLRQMYKYDKGFKEIISAVKDDSNYYGSKFTGLTDDEKLERAIAETVDYVRKEFFELAEHYNVDLDL